MIKSTALSKNQAYFNGLVEGNSFPQKRKQLLKHQQTKNQIPHKAFKQPVQNGSGER